MSAATVALAVTGPAEARADPVEDGLRAAGVDVVRAGWDDPAEDWSVADVVIVRSPTGYLERHGEFVAWADRVAMAADLWNPVELLRWNVHREYLLDLESRGVDVLPTRLVRSTQQAVLAELGAAEGWERLVLKPATTAGTLGVTVVDAAGPAGQDELAARQRFGDVVVQPYVPSIHDEGELRLALVGGEPVAATRRVPAEEDFGVQANKMSAAGELVPPDGAVEVARSALAALGRRTLHARADLLLVDGTWRLAELQLVEPDRMLRDVPSSLDALVGAIVDLAR